MNEHDGKQQAEQERDAVDSTREFAQILAGVSINVWGDLLLKFATVVMLLFHMAVAPLLLLMTVIVGAAYATDLSILIIPIGMCVLGMYSIVAAVVGFFRCGQFFTRRTAARAFLCSIGVMLGFLILIALSVSESSGDRRPKTHLTKRT